MTLAIDGSGAFVLNTGSTSSTLTISTSSSNDIIYVIAINSAAFATQNISDSSDLTWNTRIAYQAANGNTVSAWWAAAPSALSGDVITIDFPSSNGTFNQLMAIAISGANTSSPFDPNLSSAAVYNAGDPTSVTTTNANDMVLGFGSCSTQNPTAGSGFSLAFGEDFAGLETKVVSSAQSGLSVGWGTGASTFHWMFVDAIVAAAGGGGGAALASMAIPRKMFLPPKKKFYLNR
jgi:hypothetical protein